MRIIGLDIGAKRIGVAISDPDEKMALPLKVVDRETDDQAIKDILNLADEYDAGMIIYGSPLTLAGEKGGQSDSTEDFVEALSKKTNILLTATDERMTTKEAERVLLEQNIKRQARKQIIDKVAAALILQTFLDKPRP